MTITNKIATLPWHPGRRWSVRDLTSINKIIIHQELGEGDIEAVNRYHIRPNHISPQGCPHFCYHYGIEKSGQIIQANELAQITWHTPGQNTVGIGIMLVGNFNGPGHDLGTTGPNPEQMASLEWLVEYLNKAFAFSNQELYGHYHFGKPACPGFALQEWIETRRSRIEGVSGVDKVKKTLPEIQKRLNALGYSCGEEDGIMGVKTLAAIRAFQTDEKIKADGVVGPQTWKHLLQKSEP